MTDTLAPVELTNWALSAWNSTLDRNDVPSAWLYGQDHLWATSHLVSSPGDHTANIQSMPFLGVWRHVMRPFSLK